jgi:hypothetical protein
MDTQQLSHVVGSIARNFCIPGKLVHVRRYGSGHINDTFAASYRTGGGTVRYLHQRINDRVFADIPALMENVGRVTRHVAAKLRASGVEDAHRRCLTLIPAIDGTDVFLDEDGRYWRSFLFIEASRSDDLVSSAKNAYDAAKAFGEFTFSLRDLPGPALNETIVGFHDTPRRLRSLENAVADDTHQRAAGAGKEIAWCLQHAALADALQQACRSGTLQSYVTHNDTKANNVLLDRATGEALCVVDLDTVMPGLLLYDFGDLARTAAMSAHEDEPDTSKVRVLPDRFSAVARGFLAGAGGLVQPADREYLLIAAMVMTLESALRFLTDYLRGDRYFAIRRPEQNLSRARTQLALLASFEEQRDALQHRLETEIA